MSLSPLEWTPAMWYQLHTLAISAPKEVMKPYLKELFRNIQVDKFKKGIRICQNIYRHYAARKIQHAWDNYWYRPNKQGVSRAGQTGYQMIQIMTN